METMNVLLQDGSMRHLEFYLELRLMIISQQVTRVMRFGIFFGMQTKKTTLLEQVQQVRETTKRCHQMV